MPSFALRPFRRKLIALVLAGACAAAGAATLGAVPAAAISAPTLYATNTTGETHFLNHPALLATGGTTVNDPNWYEQNIPFLQVPDAQIQDVYYYRWQTYKEHLVYTGPQYGYLSNEFLQPVGYGAPYGGVNAAAGHHITEGRWLRDQQYVKDDINYWLAGPGQFPKQQNDGVNPDTSDWAHEYSFWSATSVWQTYLATGDAAFATAELANLVKQYRGWDNHFNPSLGMYWQVPVWDATEYTPASLESSDPYHGGAGYRPTINAYQYGDARAIASIAALSQNSATANEYTNRASALQTAVQTHLWDPTRAFFYDQPRDNNPTNKLLDTREEEGFVPFMFDMPQASDVKALSQLFDPQGFAATYGPTTVERRSRWFDYQDSTCCRWDGPSWPYETSQTLTGVANVLDDYPAQSTVTAANYLSLLHTYAATQFKNGVPYVAEAHDADANSWIYDSTDHSEDYNHSTYNDNVISGLIGLRGLSGNNLLLKPLAPASWDYFALENTPYHGHNLTVLWDRTGSKYGQGAGLHVYVDGAKVVSQASLAPVSVPIPATIVQSNNGGTVNVAANGQRFSYAAKPIASYSFSGDCAQNDNCAWNAIDGITYRTGIPEDSRWTTYGTPNATDYFGVNFQRSQLISDVRLTFYADGSGVRTPASYDLQYWTGFAWATVPGQSRSLAKPTGNAVNQILFPPLHTTQLRVVAPNGGGGIGWGLSEFSAWAAPVFQIANVNSGKLLAVSNTSQATGANVQQFSDTGTADHLWELVDAGGGYYKIVNINSGLVLAIQDGSTALSAQVQQSTDNSTNDQQWRVVDSGGGQYKIQNRNSGQVLGVDGESTADSANVVQYSDTGTTDHLWRMLPAASGPAAAPAPVFKIGNVNSGKLLAVINSSLATGANVQQFSDTGTLDQRWKLVDAGSGYYKIVNVNSGLLLAVQYSSTALSAPVQQSTDNATMDQQWRVILVGFGAYKIQNRNSGLLLGVDGESTADSANIVQYSDTGTKDHLWTMTPVASTSALNDDFESGVAPQWVPKSGNWSVCRPATYEYCSTSTADSVSLAGSAFARTYTVDASVVANSSPTNSGIALLGRAQDGTHYYQAELKRDSTGTQVWDISKNVGGTFSVLASGTFSWPSGAGHYTNIRFSVQGNTLTMGVYQSGSWQTLGTAHDGQYGAGRIGVRTWGLTGSFDIVHAYAG